MGPNDGIQVSDPNLTARDGDDICGAKRRDGRNPASVLGSCFPTIATDLYDAFDRYVDRLDCEINFSNFEKHRVNPKYRYTKPFLSALLSICVAMPLATSATENDPGAWITFSTTDAFQSDGEDSRWHYWFDAQARYFDLGSGVNQWLARPGIGYEISDNVKGWVGYARFRTRNRAGNVADENRYWQQIDWSAGRWNGGRFSMRARLEQRSVSVGDDVGLVIRFLTKYVRPIGESESTTLIVGIEPIVDLKDTDWGGESGLGQNRLFIGFGRRLSNQVSIEAGYMNQYLWMDNADNRSNHFGVLNFKVKL